MSVGSSGVARAGYRLVYGRRKGVRTTAAAGASTPPWGNCWLAALVNSGPKVTIFVISLLVATAAGPWTGAMVGKLELDSSSTWDCEPWGERGEATRF